MSFLLVSESGAQTGWTHFAWAIVRQLAEDSGWRPYGTLPPSDWDPRAEAIGAWDGRYTSNDGQLVTARDASELAAALERAVASTEFEHRIQQLNRVGTEKLQPAGLSAALDDDASSWRRDIESFVTFCRKGAFRIF